MEFVLESVVAAKMGRVYDYYANVQGLTKLHPQYVKSVNIIQQDPSSIVFEMTTLLMGREFRSKNRTIFEPPSGMTSETIDGYGKGSVVKWSFLQTDAGTKIVVQNEVKLGLLGQFFKDRIQKI